MKVGAITNSKELKNQQYKQNKKGKLESKGSNHNNLSFKKILLRKLGE